MTSITGLFSFKLHILIDLPLEWNWPLSFNLELRYCKNTTQLIFYYFLIKMKNLIILIKNFYIKRNHDWFYKNLFKLFSYNMKWIISKRNVYELKSKLPWSKNQ